MGWGTDYPYAGINLMTRVSGDDQDAGQRRRARRTELLGGAADWTTRSSRCPFTMATDVGTAEFSAEEARRLREYLLKGGFLWVDDFWGTPAWEQWSSEMQQGAAGISDRGRAAGPSDSADACSSSSDSAGDQHQLLAAQRRRHLRARRGQSTRRLPHDCRRARPDHGADDAQHRHRRFVGTRGRGSASSSCSSRRTATRSASTSCSTR